MNIYACFGGQAYDPTTARIVADAPRLGADKVLVYDDRWLTEQPFYRLNRWLWDHPGDARGNKRGFGWFAWKPFVMLDALSRAQEGDTVLFTDADTFPIANFSMLYDECVRLGGIMLFAASGCRNENWCKRDTFVVMSQDEERFRFSQHAVARFMVFQKGPWLPQQFLMEWLAYCLNPRANTFDASVLAPEYPDLREPRAEQAILTLLAHKYGLKLHREACQFGEGYPEDRELFPQLFFQQSSALPRSEAGSIYRNV